MRFVETPVFTAAVTSLLSDEEYRQLQLALLIRPAQGVLIRGSGGLRKLRWGARDVGSVVACGQSTIGTRASSSFTCF
jgi:hypothetical protein